MARVLEC